MNRCALKSSLSSVLFFLLAWTVAVSGARAGKVEIDAGTEIKLRAPNGLDQSSGSLHVGDTVMLQVAQNVQVSSTVVIDTTATARGVVTAVTKSAKPGKPGKLSIRIVSVCLSRGFRSSEGSQVGISGEFEKQGTGRQFFSWVLGFGLLIRGGEAKLEDLDLMTAKVPAAVTVEN